MSATPAAAAAAAADSLSFQGLNQLKAAAQARDPKAVMAVARQFEAMLLQQMLSAMDATSFGPDLMDQTSGPLYRSLFNQQIATTVSQGRGIGLASFLARELSSRYGVKPAAPNASAPLAAGAAVAPAVPPAAPALAVATPGASTDTGLGATLEQARHFAASILPSIRAAAARLGVAPRALLAQAALETGWGRHMAGNNLFGIKAGQAVQQETFTALTKEFRNGVAGAETAVFRAYDRLSASVHDYANLLLDNGRYRAVRGLGSDVPAFAQALQRAGYASDPHYAGKLVAVAYSPQMQAALAGPQAAPAQVFAARDVE